MEAQTFTQKELLALVLERRDVLKLTKDDVARMTGLSRQTVGAVEMGVLASHTDAVLKYRDALLKLKSESQLKREAS